MLIGALLIPLSIAIAIDLSLFFLVGRTLHDAATRARHRPSDKEALGLEPEQYLSQLKAQCVIVFVLGVAWIYGALINTSSGDSSVFLQYCFAIFVILEGVFVVFFHVVTDKTAKGEACSAWAQSTAGQIMCPHRSRVFPLCAVCSDVALNESSDRRNRHKASAASPGQPSNHGTPSFQRDVTSECTQASDTLTVESLPETAAPTVDNSAVLPRPRAYPVGSRDPLHSFPSQERRQQVP